MRKTGEIRHTTGDQPQRTTGIYPEIFSRLNERFVFERTSLERINDSVGRSFHGTILAGKREIDVCSEMDRYRYVTREERDEFH